MSLTLQSGKCHLFAAAFDIFFTACGVKVDGHAGDNYEHQSTVALLCFWFSLFAGVVVQLPPPAAQSQVQFSSHGPFFVFVEATWDQNRWSAEGMVTQATGQTSI